MRAGDDAGAVLEAAGDLESLDLVPPARDQITTPSFTDGEALWTVVEEQDLEGLVAMPLGSLHKPGERSWLRVTNTAPRSPTRPMESHLLTREHSAHS